jgi:hypothetical protein
MDYEREYAYLNDVPTFSLTILAVVLPIPNIPPGPLPPIPPICPIAEPARRNNHTKKTMGSIHDAAPNRVLASASVLYKTGT